jgi:hypothetical protein
MGVNVNSHLGVINLTDNFSFLVLVVFLPVFIFVQCIFSTQLPLLYSLNICLSYCNCRLENIGSISVE